MQAIVTKFHGATNHRGARVSARCQAKRITVSWDDGLGVEGNHDKAANELATQLGWIPPHYSRLIGGALPDGTGNCYVFAPKEMG